MTQIATFPATGNTRAPTIWRPEPPISPAFPGSYRQLWLTSRFGFDPATAALLAELQFEPVGRRA